MKDPELKFWTTTPNIFLVATTESGKIVGCICYRQINPDTVEMCHLAVDGEFRNLSIGRKLVQALMDTATENGYDVLYVATSTAQMSARRLYEKMNFKILPYNGFGPVKDFLTGKKRCAYKINLK